AMTSAKTAVRRITSTSAKPKRPSGSASRWRSAGARAGAGAVPSKAGADTGIEPGDQEVGGERAEREERGGDQHRAAHYREIAGDDGVEHEFAGAGPREDDLREDRAREQIADPDAEQRHGRQHGEAQGVAEYDPALGKSVSARGADVVLAEHLEHGG